MATSNLTAPVHPPTVGESATDYACRVAQQYADVTGKQHRKNHGQYFTPPAVARWMGSLCSPRSHIVRLLDPGAGAGILACAAVEHLASLGPESPAKMVIEAYETDDGIVAVLTGVLTHLRDIMAAREISLEFVVRQEDFVLANAGALEGRLSLFEPHSQGELFDIAIANPPYFKIARSSAHARIADNLVHGQPNIYALFMALCASMLVPNGQLVFITPRSFTSGVYFRAFRHQFFETMRPELIHVFSSRKDAFSHHDVLQENVIIKALRDDGWWRRDQDPAVTISSSAGAADIDRSCQRERTIDAVIDMPSSARLVRLPVTDKDDAAIRVVQSWTGRLKDYGLQVSTGPVVPFRATQHMSEVGQVGTTHAPLVWMHHVRPFCIEWPNGCRKPQYLRWSPETRPLLVKDQTCVLVRRFSSKEQPRRLTAAPYVVGSLKSSVIGLENHLNYVYRPTGSMGVDEAWGLAVLFNSSLLDTYFRTLSGNTQVGAAELRTMPLPPLETIVRLGRLARRTSPLHEDAVDELVEAECDMNGQSLQHVVARG
jgi:adenine-specific DNA-methyltransferase